jgi:hypothetical protein
MKHAMGLLAALALAATALPSAAAQPAAEDAAVPATLAEWLARDLAVGRAAPGPSRDAELALLQRAVVEGLTAARAAEDARAVKGERLEACLPPPGTTQLTSQEIGTWLHARPPEERGEPMPQVMRRFLVMRFPCP